MGFPRPALCAPAIAACACAIGVPCASADDSLYVSNSGEQTISQFAIDGSGALAALSPAKVGAGPSPSPIAVSPDGASVYVANSGGGSVSQYSVAADGTLTPKTPPTQAAGSNPGGIAVNPDGKSVYAVDVHVSGGIYQYDIGAGGVLQPKSTPKVTASELCGGITVHPDGKTVYVAACSAPGRVLQYNVDSDGSLVAKNPPFVQAGTGTTNVAVNPDGKSVYAANTVAHSISQYDVNFDGTLAAKSTPTVATNLAPWAFAIGKDGTSVYVTGYGADQAHDNGEVSQFSVGAGGALSPKSPGSVATGPDPRSAVLSSDGAHLYVTNRASSQEPSKAGVFEYDVAGGGALVPHSPSLIASGSLPDGVAISPIRVPPQTPGGGAGGSAVQHTRITSGPGGTTGSAPTFTFVSDLPNATFECRFDDEPFRPCRSPLTRYALKFGPHTFRVRSLEPDDLGDSRSFTLAVVTEDRSCTVDAAFDPAPDEDFCIFYGDCPANSECRVDELRIDTTDPSRMGSGAVDLAVCRRGGRLGDPRTCRVSLDRNILINILYCYFPTAGGPLAPACPETLKNQYADSAPPVTRYAAACHLYQLLRGGVGQVTCTVRLRLKPADPLSFVGGQGGLLGVFAAGPGRLTVAPGSSSRRRVSAAATSSRPFTTIKKTIKQEGWVTLRPKLSRRTAAALRKRRKLKLRIKVTFVPQEGEKVVRTQTVVLRTAPCRVRPPTRGKDGKLSKPRRVCS